MVLSTEGGECSHDPPSQGGTSVLPDRAGAETRIKLVYIVLQFNDTDYEIVKEWKWLFTVPRLFRSWWCVTVREL
eukprot:COSAG02_NODE_4218_length_5619_cov_1.862138_1_plen_75_part_00